MACALFNRYSKKHRASSAGARVREQGIEGTTNGPLTIRAMAKEGFDISKGRRLQVTPELLAKADRAIILMTKSERKYVPAYLQRSSKATFWNVADLNGRSYAFHVRQRKRIEKLVKKLVEEIG